MKFRHCITGLFWVVVANVLVSCHSPQREARQMVRRAELLADTQPDSTARLIDSVLRMPVYFSERQRMEMALLQAEALFSDMPLDDDGFEDTAYYVVTSLELERAADYYAKKNQYVKAAHAALYSGYVQQHYNEKETAMHSYKTAEQYGLLTNDSLTVARAEYRMGKMLFEEFMETESLKAFRLASNSFGNYCLGQALAHNGMAVCYIIKGDFASAEACLKQSLSFAESSHSDKMKIKVLNNYSVLYCLQQEYDKSIAYLKQMAEETELDVADSLFLFLNMGKVFMAEREMDSAAVYFNLLETLLPSTKIRRETKESAYGALANYAGYQGRPFEALQYKDAREALLSEIMNTRQEQTIYRIQQQYDYEMMQNEMSQKIIHRQRIITFLSMMAVIALLVLAYSQIRLARMRKQEAEANANLFHFMQQNKALVESNMAHKKEILDTTQQLSDLLNARLRAMQQLDYCLKTPKDKIALKDLEQEVFGSGDHWEAIKEVLVALYPGLWESLKLKYPEMDEMELRVSMLSHLKLSRLAESTLLGISTSVLDKLRTKVRKIMTEDKTL